MILFHLINLKRGEKIILKASRMNKIIKSPRKETENQQFLKKKIKT